MLDKNISVHRMTNVRKKTSLSKAVFGVLSRCTKMKKKVKSLSHALSRTKKSWDLKSSSTFTPEGSDNVVLQAYNVIKDSQSIEGRQEIVYPQNSPKIVSDEEKKRTTIQLLATLDHMTVSRFSSKAVKGISGEDDKTISANNSRESHDKEQTVTATIRTMDQGVHTLGPFVPAQKPPICPPPTQTCQLYTNPEVFSKMDNHAIECSNRGYHNLKELVKDLTKGCQNELEKARVIFRWVIAKDLERHDVDHNGRRKPYTGRRRSSYHKIYQKLCRYAGLQCEVIHGYSKGTGYKPGMPMFGGSFRNSWTAVLINDSWRFVNCTWAARHVTGSSDNIDEFYFLTDPEDYIFEHYPDEPTWQLLEKPLPLVEFLNLPVVKSTFLRNGLRFSSAYDATLGTEDGKVEIRLNSVENIKLGSKLRHCETYQAVSSQRTELRFVNDEVVFTVTPSGPGRYYFSVYVGDSMNSGSMESACCFLIDCPEPQGGVNVSGHPGIQSLDVGQLK